MDTCVTKCSKGVFPWVFFRGNGSSPSRNRSINLSSIDAGKRVNKLGGKARKILENGSPPLTISEAILLFTVEGRGGGFSGRARVGLALDRTLNQIEKEREKWGPQKKREIGSQNWP